MSTEPNALYVPNPLCKWVSVQNAANPSFPRWNVKSVLYCYRLEDEMVNPPRSPYEAPTNGSVNFYVNVLDAFDNPLGGVWVWQGWKDGTADKWTDRNGEVDFVMSGDSSFAPDRDEVGPYSCYLRAKDYPTATVHGLGLPLKRHYQYRITFALALTPDAPPPPPPPITLEEAVMAEAHSVAWMPINNNGALWKFAKAHQLEDAQTDELTTLFDGVPYTLQVFNKGIVYARTFDWANIKVIPK